MPPRDPHFVDPASIEDGKGGPTQGTPTGSNTTRMAVSIFVPAYYKHRYLMRMRVREQRATPLNQV